MQCTSAPCEEIPTASPAWLTTIQWSWQPTSITSTSSSTTGLLSFLLKMGWSASQTSTFHRTPLESCKSRLTSWRQRKATSAGSCKGAKVPRPHGSRCQLQLSAQPSRLTPTVLWRQGDGAVAGPHRTPCRWARDLARRTEPLQSGFGPFGPRSRAKGREAACGGDCRTVVRLSRTGVRVNPFCELTPTPGDKGPSTGKTIRSVIRQHATGEGREKVGVGCRRR